MWASSLVLASFMAGLGLGNALAARFGRSVRRPVRLYAVLEIVVGVLGAAIVFALPGVGHALARLATSAGLPPAALNSLRFSASFLLLVAPAGAMGLTLPLLTRALMRTHPRFGENLGALYGWNTLGISIYPDDGAIFDSLLQKADTAMYNAKDAGRNTYRFFDEVMNLRAHDHLLLQNRLHLALTHEQFTLCYQPQVDIASGRIIGVETLLRWHDAELGEVAPARFIPVAEDCGLIVPIGSWVLVEACLQAQAWRAAGLPDMTVSVNLSALQFRRFNLIETVAGALKRSGLPPHLLELERVKLRGRWV